MSIGQTLPQNVIDEFVGNAHGNLARVKELLTQYPALANANASWNESPIQAAAQTGQREIVNLLLAAGAPLDICTAAMMGMSDEVAARLQSDPSQAQAKGAHGIPALYYPIIVGRPDIAERLLAHGAPIDPSEGNTTALHGAIMFGQVAMVAWLLARGADANRANYEGKTPLQMALDRKQSDIAALLRQHGGVARESGFAEVSNGQLYYETMGEGHPLVLIHAGVADHRMWDEQFAAFAQTYRAIRYDLRGYGQTKSEVGVSYTLRQDLYDLLHHLKEDKAYVLGLSMGGSLAVDFALEHPEIVAALMPCASGLSGYEHKHGEDTQSKFEAQAFVRMEELWEQKQVEAMQEMELQMWVDGPLQSPTRVPHEIREKVRAMNALAYTHNDENTKPQRLDPPAIGRLVEIKAPTLVIVGDLDTHDVTEACDILAEGIVGARAVVIPGTAHMLNMEKPDEFNRVVLEFLSSL